jgi:glutaredoxin
VCVYVFACVCVCVYTYIIYIHDIIYIISIYMIMYVIIGKQKCIQCDELKNLFDEKGIQYNYLEMTEMPHITITYLRMYCNSFQIVLNINHSFSNFEDISTHFNHI